MEQQLGPNFIILWRWLRTFTDTLPGWVPGSKSILYIWSESVFIQLKIKIFSWKSQNMWNTQCRSVWVHELSQRFFQEPFYSKSGENWKVVMGSEDMVPSRTISPSKRTFEFYTDKNFFTSLLKCFEQEKRGGGILTLRSSGLCVRTFQEDWPGSRLGSTTVSVSWFLFFRHLRCAQHQLPHYAALCRLIRIFSPKPDREKRLQSDYKGMEHATSK